MKYKIDLHTHSILSQDGGIRREDYAELLGRGVLDCIAITDHNETKFAIAMNGEFGDKIIVGEEISTKDGEIIGLFLKKKVARDLSAEQTVLLIHEQGGVVYIPHPFETGRQGIQMRALEKIAEEIDVIEVFNGRSRWRGKKVEAEAFAKKYDKAGAASSDSHCRLGMGRTFSVLSEVPERKSLVKLLGDGHLQREYAPAVSYLCPMVNRVRNATRF